MINLDDNLPVPCFLSSRCLTDKCTNGIGDFFTNISILRFPDVKFDAGYCYMQMTLSDAGGHCQSVGKLYTFIFNSFFTFDHIVHRQRHLFYHVLYSNTHSKTRKFSKAVNLFLKSYLRLRSYKYDHLSIQQWY